MMMSSHSVSLWQWDLSIYGWEINVHTDHQPSWSPSSPTKSDDMPAAVQHQSNTQQRYITLVSWNTPEPCSPLPVTPSRKTSRSSELMIIDNHLEDPQITFPNIETYLHNKLSYTVCMSWTTSQSMPGMHRSRNFLKAYNHSGPIKTSSPPMTSHQLG